MYLPLLLVNGGLTLYVCRVGRARSALRSLLGRGWDNVGRACTDLALAAAVWLVIEVVEAAFATSGNNAALVLLPHSVAERAIWVPFATTVAFCEEVVYRGYLQTQLARGLSMLRPCGSSELVSIVHDRSGAMASTRSVERLRTLCADVGFDLERVRPSILDRMRLLAETTQTLNDGARAVRFANAVFRYYDVSKPLRRFTALERRIVVIGTLFSDIGKSGPAGAAPDGQLLVAEMFAVEHVIDERTTVARFFEAYFPTDATHRARRFGALGLDAGMTMREFWNLHTAWTLHILQGDGVPMEAVPAAAAHHILENVNPDSLVAADGRFTKYFGKHASFERPEKLVILLDKYDAALRRGRRTHDQAIAFLRNVIARSLRFGGDPEFLELIEDLDEVMKVPDVLVAAAL